MTETINPIFALAEILAMQGLSVGVGKQVEPRPQGSANPDTLRLDLHDLAGNAFHDAQYTINQAMLQYGLVITHVWNHEIDLKMPEENIYG